jgi:hypothetical protein
METKYLAFCRNTKISLSASVPDTPSDFPITLGWQDVDGLRVYLEITPNTATLIHSRKFNQSKTVNPAAVTNVCKHDIEIDEDDLTNFKLFMQHGMEEEIQDFKNYCFVSLKKELKLKEKGKAHEDEIDLSNEEIIQLCNWKAWMRHNKRVRLAETMNDPDYEEHLRLNLPLPFTLPHHIKLVIKGRTAKVLFCPAPFETKEEKRDKDALKPPAPLSEKKKCKNLVLTFDRIGCAPATPNAYDTLGIAKIIKYGVVEDSVNVKY